MFVNLFAIYVCFVVATDEHQNLQKSAPSQSGFTLSGHAAALIVLALSLILVIVVWKCHRRKTKKKEETKQVEEEQMKWFEKQRKQLKTPVKNSSVLNITCTSVPVARFRGKLCNLPTKLPVLDLIDSSSALSFFEFPEEMNDAEKIESQKVNIGALFKRESTCKEVPLGGAWRNDLALEVVESMSELRSNLELDMEVAETTVEYVSMGSNL